MAIIETGIPIPVRTGRKPRYEFHKLNVGESVLEDGPPKDVPVKTHIANIRASARSHGAQTRKKFITRTEGESLRVWRIE